MNVAMIATNGDQHLSSLISEALSKCEHVSVEKSNNSTSYLEVVCYSNLVHGRF